MRADVTHTRISVYFDNSCRHQERGILTKFKPGRCVLNKLDCFLSSDYATTCLEKKKKSRYSLIPMMTFPMKRLVSLALPEKRGRQSEASLRKAMIGAKLKKTRVA